MTINPKEMPITFSNSMVNALLAGKKNQTRRIIKISTQMNLDMLNPAPKHGRAFAHFSDYEKAICINIPYGKVGDRLWVRETYMPDAPRDGSWGDVEFYDCNMSPISMIPKKYQKSEHCIYRADWKGQELVGWKPSIHMPRWASRITLEITGIRIERLLDITEDDAKAEGIFWTDYGKNKYQQQQPGWYWDKSTSSDQCLGSARHAYGNLFEKINGPGSWDKNPWVWVVEFKRVNP